MADLNVFNHGAFNMTSLSTAIQQAPYAPQLLGQLEIAESRDALIERVRRYFGVQA